MTYTKIHAIKATVDKTIEYICNPDAYFRRYESQIILYGGARRVLEQAGIRLKGLNVDKLRAEYQALETQKKELTATYKNCEKEVRDLKRKQENL